MKLKTEEYRLLHKVLTQTSARVIWEYLKDGKPLANLLERVPDEFFAWVKATSKDLAGQYSELHHRTQHVYREVTTAASIPTPLPIGEQLSLRELETLNRAMKRELHRQFATHPEIESFLHILHAARGKGKREQLAQAIWESLRPAAPKVFHNIGSLWRSAALFGADFLFTIGERYSHQPTDTMKVVRHIPLWHFADYEDFQAHLAVGCKIVCMELAEQARPLPQLVHPPRAIYLLGAEDDGLPLEILADNLVVQIPTDLPISLNVAVTGSLLLYDRYLKTVLRETR